MLLMAYIEEEEISNKSEVEETVELLLMAYTENEKKIRKKAWFLDSGCSNHMSEDISLFSTLDNNFKHLVKLGKNKRIEVIGKGNVKLMLNGDGYIISEVYYVPELKNNLLSLDQLQEKRLMIII